MDPTEVLRRLIELGVPQSDAEEAVTALARGDRIPMLRCMLLRTLWADVVDEGKDGAVPEWIARWKTLAESKFPFINASALERLLADGIDPHDLTDVVRSAQVLTVCNLAIAVEDGWQIARAVLGDEMADQLGWTVVAVDPAAPEPPNALGDLHGQMGEYDPSGRAGEPRSLEERVLSGFSEDERREIRALIGENQLAKAALLWKRHTGQELDASLLAIQRLRATIGQPERITGRP